MSDRPVVLRSVREYKAWRNAQKGSLGFVPTMGYLHAGHLSLVDRAGQENDTVVVSIFVNPTQFGPHEDLTRYPRDLDRDLELLSGKGVAVVFHPTPAEIYPTGYHTFVEVREITNTLEGEIRPGHFTGVSTVVNILFNIVQPERAYFGQKDAQQLAVIQRMVTDLRLPVSIVPCPIVREEDGLAMSSRNVYLLPEDRAAALVLSRALFAAREKYDKGERRGQVLRTLVREAVQGEPRANLDYASLADPLTMQEIDQLEGGTPVLLSVAARFGGTRLIDNIILA